MTDLRLDLRNALGPSGDFDRIGKELEQAETLGMRLGDARRLSRTAVYRAHHFWVVARYDEALEASRRARELAGPADLTTTAELAASFRRPLELRGNGHAGDRPLHRNDSPSQRSRVVPRATLFGARAVGNVQVAAPST